MKAVKSMLMGLKIKVDPHFVLLILVIMFVVLLVATENVFKSTLIPQ